MVNLFKKKNNSQVRLQNVKTLLESSIRGHDNNQNGVPDYLERPDLASLVNSNKDLSRYESDTAEEVEAWIMGLRGYEFDPGKNIYVPVSPPTLNEIGIKAVLTHIKTVVNKHSINTALKIEEVHEICENHNHALIKWFMYNARKSGVQYSDLTRIIVEFDSISFIVLTRSVNDGQRQHTTNRTKLTGNLSQPSHDNFPG